MHEYTIRIGASNTRDESITNYENITRNESITRYGELDLSRTPGITERIRHAKVSGVTRLSGEGGVTGWTSETLIEYNA